jgi:hypothetical protein
LRGDKFGVFSARLEKAFSGRPKRRASLRQINNQKVGKTYPKIASSRTPF